MVRRGIQRSRSLAQLVRQPERSTSPARGPDPRSLVTAGGSLAASGRRTSRSLTDMPGTGESTSTQSLATALPHSSDSPSSPPMPADQVDPRTVPLPGDETDAFVAVGPRGRPVKKPRQNQMCIRDSNSGARSSRVYRSVLSFVAVSYTHLDVYKRQEQC